MVRHELYMELPNDVLPPLDGVLLFNYRGYLIVKEPDVEGGRYYVELRSFEHLEDENLPRGNIGTFKTIESACELVDALQLVE